MGHVGLLMARFSQVLIHFKNKKKPKQQKQIDSTDVILSNDHDIYKSSDIFLHKILNVIWESKMVSGMNKTHLI